MPQAQLPHAASGTEELTRALNEVVAAIDRARSVGLPVTVPEGLYLACAEIVARHEGPRPSDGSGSRSSSRRTPGPAVDHASVHDVPLRRLLWQVLDPGEEFTVHEVVRRLASLGVHPHPNAVSNALGYWVSRRRLHRLRKGVYLYPVDTAGNARNEGASQEVSAGGGAATKRRDTTNKGVHEEKAQAM
jgi:hypothetical protein